MEIIEAIEQALKTQGAGNILTIAAMYIACPLVMHIYIQLWKGGRKKAGQPIGPWTLRAVASGGTFALATFIGWRLGKWPVDEAIDHAFIIAAMYPLAMWVYLSRLEKYEPELAKDLGGDPTELRVVDDTEPPRAL